MEIDFKNRLIKKVSRIHDGLKSFQKSVEDRGLIWENLPNASSIAELINSLIYANPSAFKGFLNPSRNNLLIYLKSASYDKKQVEIKGIEQWIHEFYAFVNIFIEFVFYEFFYYETYDSFSENSRDNDRKIDFIVQLSKKNDFLLEVGFGTGPLFRRLMSAGFNIYGLEFDKAMIGQSIKRMPNSSRLIQGDFFNYPFGRNTFDLLIMESGLFLFTAVTRSRLTFEMFQGMGSEKLKEGISKAYSLLKPNGKFLIGIQGLMKKVKIGENFYFKMKRKEINGHVALRILTYYRKKGIFSRKEVIFKINQQKPIMSFEEFSQIVKSNGFNHISVSKDRLWVILQK